MGEKEEEQESVRSVFLVLKKLKRNQSERFVVMLFVVVVVEPTAIERLRRGLIKNILCCCKTVVGDPRIYLSTLCVQILNVIYTALVHSSSRVDPEEELIDRTQIGVRC